MIGTMVHTFTGKVPVFHLKVFALPVLLSNIVMLVYRLSVQSLQQSILVSGVFHDSSFSDFFV